MFANLIRLIVVLIFKQFVTFYLILYKLSKSPFLYLQSYLNILNILNSKT